MPCLLCRLRHFTALFTSYMLLPFRSALLVIAALSAGSIAPAQVGPTTEPLIASTSATLPSIVTPQQIVIPAMESAIESGTQALEAEEQAERQAEEEKRVQGSLSEMVAQLRSADPGSRELECLAVGIYFESKGESLDGQLAVGEVIANRAESGRFPSSYCGVLFQRSQFSFIRGKSLPTVPRTSRQWSTAVAIAKIVDQDLQDSSASNALFFHAKRVSPGWKLKRVASIGNHIFYR